MSGSNEQGPPNLPAPPASPETGGSAGNPWERRATLGTANGFIEALQLFVTAPTEAFAQTIKQGDFGSPLLFAIIVGWIGVALGQIWETLMGASILSMLPAEVRNQVPFVMGSAGSFLFNVIFAPVFIIVGLFIGSAILHLCLIVVGGLGQSRAGFEGSFRVVAYSTVAQLANVVPIVGGMISLVWTLFLAVIGAQKIHHTDQGKAVLAVLIPVVLCCVCFGMAIFVAGASLMSLFAQQ
jgi:hypothetical protein